MVRNESKIDKVDDIDIAEANTGPFAALPILEITVCLAIRWTGHFPDLHMENLGREMEMRVATIVADQWQVDPHQLILEWGRVRDGVTMAPDTPLEVRGRATGTNFTVVFSPLSSPPFAVGVRVGRRVAVPLTTRPLPVGHVITEGDVKWGEWVMWNDQVHDAPVDRLPLGWRLRTSLAAGQPVRSPAASAPPLVSAGANVEVVWHKRLVMVRLNGVAMHDAYAGQQVRVRLDQGRGNIRGLVMANGQVELSSN